MSAGDRYRLVTIAGGEEHVSSVVLGADEVRSHLALEAEWHRIAGWIVTEGDGIIVCRRLRDGRRRIVEARRFGALSDTREEVRT